MLNDECSRIQSLPNWTLKGTGSPKAGGRLSPTNNNNNNDDPIFMKEALLPICYVSSSLLNRLMHPTGESHRVRQPEARMSSCLNQPPRFAAVAHVAGHSAHRRGPPG